MAAPAQIAAKHITKRESQEMKLVQKCVQLFPSPLLLVLSLSPKPGGLETPKFLVPVMSLERCPNFQKTHWQP